MDFRTLIKSELLVILDKAIETVYAGGDWYSIFPKVTGFKYFMPEGYEDIIEENPNTFRRVDHAIAHRTVKHSELHPKIAELVKVITVGNAISDKVIMADIFEHAGTHFASELALSDKQYIKLYADFLFTNDIYYERFQHFDFVRIVRKWDWCSEVYYLLFTHMFTESKYFHDDLDYLNYTGYSLHKGLLDNKEEADVFLGSLGLFFKNIAYDIKNEELNTQAVGLFGELIEKHIFPEEKEKSEALKNRYHEVVEKLLRKEAVSELTEETNTTATVEIFQQYDDDDIAEI